MTRSEQVIYILGAEATPTNIEQLGVLLEAYDIFLERNARYKDIWRDGGWRGNLFDLKKKITRMWRVFWQRGAPEEIFLDDAFDAINYATFFIRNQRESNEYGTWS